LLCEFLSGVVFSALKQKTLQHYRACATNSFPCGTARFGSLQCFVSNIGQLLFAFTVSITLSTNFQYLFHINNIPEPLQYSSWIVIILQSVILSFEIEAWQ